MMIRNRQCTTASATSVMISLLLLLLLPSLTRLSLAQKRFGAQSQWTWLDGSQSVNQLGVYGTQGTAAATNVPGARSDHAMVVAPASGKAYMFGGVGCASDRCPSPGDCK